MTHLIPSIMAALIVGLMAAMIISGPVKELSSKIEARTSQIERALR